MLRDAGVSAAAITAILTLGALLLVSFRRVLRLEMDRHFAPLRDRVRNIDARTRLIETRQMEIITTINGRGRRPTAPTEEAP